jgi:acyl-coenzyme A synthetase/AMP-(fatty) acid ligase
MYAVEQIRRFAHEKPEATAIVKDLVPISYRQFERRIAASQRAIAARALPQGAHVATAIGDIDVDWIVNLALRSLGFTTIAIRQPADFHSIAGVEIAAVVTSGLEPAPQLDGFVPACAVRIVIGRENLVGAPDGETPPLAADSGGFIMLTSGTTGRYKMVPSWPEEGVDFVRRLADSGGFYESFVGARMANFFNFGLWTGVSTMARVLWMNGGAVVIHQGPESHRSLLPEVTHAALTPAFLANLMAAPEGAFPRNDALQLLMVGGALSENLWRATCARLTSQIFTAIGATESGIWGTTKVEEPEDLRWHRVVPGQLVQIVDESHQPLPPGRLGELRVRVEDSAGYVNDEEANRAFFREGFFYPGDLAVMDEQGRVAVHGRVTNVINVLGDKRPAEPIEAALAQALDVGAVCVLSEQAADSAEAAHVIIETAIPIPPDRLKAAAQAHLPGFGRANFHFVEKLPRNNMGKIERLKLRGQLLASSAGR